MDVNRMYNALTVSTYYYDYVALTSLTHKHRLKVLPHTLMPCTRTMKREKTK